GHELLVHGGEEVRPQQALDALRGLRTDHGRVGVLDEERGDRRTLAEVAPVAGHDGTEARLVERAHRLVLQVEALGQRLVELLDPTGATERAAARVPPGAGQRRQAGDRMHPGRAVAGPGEAVADPDVAARRRSV